MTPADEELIRLRTALTLSPFVQLIATPLIENAPNPGITSGDMPGEGVRVEPVKYLFAALAWEFHQVGQG